MNAVKEIINAYENKGYQYFAVRTGRVAKVGEILEPSHDWDFENDLPSDELLDGTCGTNIETIWFDDEEEVAEALEKAIAENKGYPGEMQYIIAGNSSEYGDDPHEVIIEDAEVIYIIK